MQNKGQCTFNESSEVLQIEPLPQIHGKRLKRNFVSPSLPSLALMVISDPFVARIVLFKCFQELKRIINDKQIPLENIKLTSLLQILQAIQFSVKSCATKGQSFCIPSPGYDKTDAVDGSNSSLRYILPQMSKLLLDLKIDKRMAIGGDLNEVSKDLVQTDRLPREGEWKSSSSSYYTSLAFLECALVDLMRPGQTNDQALPCQLLRFERAFIELNMSSQLVHERSFWLSFANVILSYKAKLSHKIRDNVTKFWLGMLRKAYPQSLCSPSHEIAIWLLNEWALFGNAIVPVDLRMKLSENFVLGVIAEKDSSSIPIDNAFVKAWDKSLGDSNSSSDDAFLSIRIEYERLLQGLPTCRVETWKTNLKLKI